MRGGGEGDSGWLWRNIIHNTFGNIAIAHILIVIFDTVVTVLGRVVELATTLTE